MGVGDGKGCVLELEEKSGTRELWALGPAMALPTPLPLALPAAATEAPEAQDRPPLNRLVSRLGARLRRGDDPSTLPRLRPPSRPEIPRLRRGALQAWWSARRAQVGLDDFLRGRLDRYLARSRITPERLPLSISVQSEHVIVAHRPARPAPGDWHARWLRENGEAALGADIERARVEADRADSALDGVRERLAEARRALEAAARAPSLASEEDGAPAYGRPAVPPPWSLAICGFIGVMVLADAWQFAVPLLRGAGITPAEILGEASRRPGAVALPLLLALGASAAMFVFTAAAVRRARSLMQLLPPRWHVAVHVLAGGVSLAMAAGLAWTIIGPGGSPGVARGVAPFLIAMALPLATPPLLRLARRLHAEYCDARRAAAEWDHVHHAAVARWTRANAVVTSTERERAMLEAARTSWTQRLHRLRTRVAEVSRIAADAADAEASELRELAHAIVTALELDRHAYLRHARQAPQGSLLGEDLDFRAEAPLMSRHVSK